MQVGRTILSGIYEKMEKESPNKSEAVCPSKLELVQIQDKLARAKSGPQYWRTIEESDGDDHGCAWRRPLSSGSRPSRLSDPGRQRAGRRRRGVGAMAICRLAQSGGRGGEQQRVPWPHPAGHEGSGDVRFRITADGRQERHRGQPRHDRAGQSSVKLALADRPWNEVEQ